MPEKHLFHSSLYQFGKPQPSYWEATAGRSKLKGKALEGMQSCDVAIIGGGYTGLSAAFHLARDYYVDVRVLEAGHIGWGASGRNGGFCTIGATKLSLKSQFSKFGADETRRFYQSQIEAVNLVRDLGIEEEIDFRLQGDSEFVVADSHKQWRNTYREWSLRRLRPERASQRLSNQCLFQTQDQKPRATVFPAFSRSLQECLTYRRQANLLRRAIEHSRVCSNPVIP